MKHTDFVHLHLHTHYSLLAGSCQIKPLIQLAKEEKMPAVAMTDSGNIFGTIEFYQEAMKQGIKPIIGCDFYMSPASRFDKSTHGIFKGAHRVVMLAKDYTGYKNLMKLASIGYLEGFYYKPRIDKEVMREYSKGLICLTGSLRGEIPHLLLTDQEDQARDVIDEYTDIFGKDNLYFEIQKHNIPEEDKVNDAFVRLGQEFKIPLVATNDVHYLAKNHARAHELMLSMQTQTTLDDPNRLRMQTDEFYFKSVDEMKEAFKDLPGEAIKNTIEITERCNLDIDFNQTHLPNFRAPDNKNNEEYFDELINEGLKKRFGNNVTSEITQRVDREKDVIKNSGYISYFLIVWDFIHYAREHQIPVGPGRGSAAGSLISYLLGITNLDPLKYNLLFERFLNKDRVSMPDIDIDFCFERRQNVIDYVVEKYGQKNVAQIITFGTMLAKGVIRDVGRVMGISYADVDRIAKLVPNELNITLKAALEQEPELKDLYENDPQITSLIDSALILEGCARHASTHAAGVVIGKDDLTNYVPLFKSNDDQISTGYPMGSLEKIGLLKMDFLGLRTLTVIDKALKIVERTRNKKIDIDNIPLDDPKTFELFCRAETIGVFQLESSGMRDLLRKLKPEVFEDIIAVLALFRPGPMGSGMLEDFIKRKHHHQAIIYDHPILEPILKDTYGIIVYQEQVMLIANKLAGLSLSEADTLRRAMSKKIPEIMNEQRKKFIDGAVKNKVDESIADKVFSLIEYFVGYGFNKSHSAAYSFVSYQTAYLKANYPAEFMTALLTSEQQNSDKVVVYIDEAKKMGINILPPDVNESYSDFTITGEDNIRFGMAAVKNVGTVAVDSIIQAREEEGEFTSLYDFTERVELSKVNRKVIESLIKCGAFDSIPGTRAGLFATVDRSIEMAGEIQKDRHIGQKTFFETFENQDSFKKAYQEVPDIPEWPENQILTQEKEMLGFYVTKHPLANYVKTLENYTTCELSKAENLRDGDEATLGGMIIKLKMTFTKKKNEKMAILSIEDLSTVMEVLVFPSAFEKCSKYIEQDAMVLIKGRMSFREDEAKLIAEEILPIEQAEDHYTNSAKIHFSTAGLEKELLNSVKTILAKYPGKLPVYLVFNRQNDKKTMVVVERDLYVSFDKNLAHEMEGLLGEGSFSFSA